MCVKQLWQTRHWLQHIVGKQFPLLMRQKWLASWATFGTFWVFLVDFWSVAQQSKYKYKIQQQVLPPVSPSRPPWRAPAPAGGAG
jgi:hypothetical protein